MPLILISTILWNEIFSRWCGRLLCSGKPKFNRCGVCHFCVISCQFGLGFRHKNNLHQFRIYLHSTCRLTWLTATKQIKASHKCFICVGEIIIVVSLPYSWPILLKGFSWGFNAMLMLTMANHAALCARCWSIVTVLGRLCDHPRSVRVRCTILDQVSSVGRELLLNSMLRVRTKWSTLSRRHL